MWQRGPVTCCQSSAAGTLSLESWGTFPDQPSLLSWEHRISAHGPFHTLLNLSLVAVTQALKHLFLLSRQLPRVISSLDTASTALLGKKVLAHSHSLSLFTNPSLYCKRVTLKASTSWSGQSKAGPHLAMSMRLWREVGTHVFSPCTNTTPLSM